MVEPHAWAPRRALVVLGLLLATLASAWSTSSANADVLPIPSGVIVNYYCADVPAYGHCYSGYSSYGGNRRALFRLWNGPGVLHEAVLLDTEGWGTAQDVYSGCVHTSSSIRASGYNASASAHKYYIAQLMGC